MFFKPRARKPALNQSSSIAFEVKAEELQVAFITCSPLDLEGGKGGVGMKAHLKDMIKAFFVIKGSAIDFLGAIYLKNGSDPEAVCRIIFPDGETIYAKKNHMTLEELGDLMYGHSHMIAEQYGYPLLHIPIPEGIDQDTLLEILNGSKKGFIKSLPGFLN